MKRKELIPGKASALATNPQAMQERLAAMRKDAGVKDKRVLHLLCSKTGRGFSIAFTRRSAKHGFQIESIDKAGGKSGWLGKLFGGLEPEGREFAAHELDFAGFACPHCGHKGSATVADLFRCNCSKLQCGGRIDVMNGVTRFACHDGCGRTGILGRSIESFSGDEGSAAKSRTAITGPGNVKRITGPARR